MISTPAPCPSDPRFTSPQHPVFWPMVYSTPALCLSNPRFTPPQHPVFWPTVYPTPAPCLSDLRFTTPQHPVLLTHDLLHSSTLSYRLTVYLTPAPTGSSVAVLISLGNVYPFLNVDLLKQNPECDLGILIYFRSRCWEWLNGEIIHFIFCSWKTSPSPSVKLVYMDKYWSTICSQIDLCHQSKICVSSHKIYFLFS